MAERRSSNRGSRPQADRPRREYTREEKIRIMKRRRERQRRLRIRRAIVLGILGLLILLVILGIGGCVKRHNKKKAEKKEAQKIEQQETESVVESAEERLARVRKESSDRGDPEVVTNLLDKSVETITFVEKYPEIKDNVPPKNFLRDGETLEPVKIAEGGRLPHLLQWDERWGAYAYGTSIIASSGCGPTCMAMIVSGLNGDPTITPAVTAQYSMDNHYITEDNSTYCSFLDEAGEHWGIHAKRITCDEKAVSEELKAGHPLIIHVGPGQFTQGGHFMVATGYIEGEDGRGEIVLNDPFSVINTEKTWKYVDIMNEVKDVWAYWK